MTTVVSIECDRQFEFGICVQRITFKTSDPREAQRSADLHGWLIGRDRDLCPTCSGRKP